MKFFAIPKPVLWNGSVITLRQYLDAKGAPNHEGHQFTIWDDPIWRSSAEAMDAWESARESVAKARTYCAMSDEAFAIFKPLALRNGQPLPPELMPLVKPIVRATSTKPEDYDEAESAPADGAAAETASAN